jgi:hypothetical protein
MDGLQTKPFCSYFPNFFMYSIGAYALIIFAVGNIQALFFFYLAEKKVANFSTAASDSNKLLMAV